MSTLTRDKAFVFFYFHDIFFCSVHEQFMRVLFTAVT